MLTDSEKAAVRLYLGHPDGYRFKNTRLESILDNLSEEAHAQIRTCLENLKFVEATILKGQNSPITSGGIKRVDEIWFDTGTAGKHAGLQSLKEAGRFYVGRISIITGVPLAGNAFGGSFAGDSFAPGNGGGNAFPFG